MEKYGFMPHSEQNKKSHRWLRTPVVAHGEVSYAVFKPETLEWLLFPQLWCFGPSQILKEKTAILFIVPGAKYASCEQSHLFQCLDLPWRSCCLLFEAKDCKKNIICLHHMRLFRHKQQTHLALLCNGFSLLLNYRLKSFYILVVAFKLELHVILKERKRNCLCCFQWNKNSHRVWWPSDPTTSSRPPTDIRKWKNWNTSIWAPMK